LKISKNDYQVEKYYAEGIFHAIDKQAM